MDHNLTDFQRRISRAEGQKNAASKAPEQFKSPRMERNERISKMLVRQEAFAKGEGMEENVSIDKTTIWVTLSAILLAVIVGGVSLILARFMRFQLTGDIGATGLDLLIDTVFAISIAFLLRELVSLSAIRHIGGQVVGIFIAIAAMHNLVHFTPDLFSRLFSAEWVQSVLATTEYGTLTFLGMSFGL